MRLARDLRMVMLHSLSNTDFVHKGWSVTNTPASIYVGVCPFPFAREGVILLGR